MNMKKGFLVLSTMAFCLSAFALSLQSDETGAIRQTLQYYLDGHATGDPEVMAKAFYPTARLQYIRNGEASIRSLESYLGGMSGQPASDESERERRILMVDYVGTVAVAKIELDYPRVIFTDYMQLLKIDGEWKIVNKIYHADRK
ncbi:MAG: nuclear transport factor 2 family protein [Gemmatimonadota bacterium]|nr:MAG: nuclear transport factor 2 family protein [Gemmatimonadota bacterium]